MALAIRQALFNSLPAASPGVVQFAAPLVQSTAASSLVSDSDSLAAS